MGDTGSTEGFGAWYGDKQGESGDLWHRTLIDPGLFRLLGPVAPGTRLLDVGCGNGYLARRLARQGAQVTAVDASRELIAQAHREEQREPLGIVYRVADAARLDFLGAGTFDVAIANMSIMDIEDAGSTFRGVARATRHGGRFVFSISHPCFDVDTRSGYTVELDPSGVSRVFRKVTDYRVLHSDRYAWDLGDGGVAVTVGYHRPLGWYAHALRDAGWVITDLDEPSPIPGFDSRRMRPEWLDCAPLHLVIAAQRAASL